MKSLPEIKADNRKAAKLDTTAKLDTSPKARAAAKAALARARGSAPVRSVPYRKPDADALAIMLRESADAVEAAATTSAAKMAAALAAPRMREAAGRLELASELLESRRVDAPAHRRLVAEVLNGHLARLG